MSTEGPESGVGGEPVGSLGEEALKLFAALQGRAKEGSQDYSTLAADAFGALTATVDQVEQHLATGGESCRYCPICRLISVLRGASPEVRQQLSNAGASILKAAAGMLETTIPETDTDTGDPDRRGRGQGDHADDQADDQADDRTDEGDRRP